MRKSEMGEIGRTDRSRYHKIRRVLETELENNFVSMDDESILSFESYYESLFPHSGEASRGLKVRIDHVFKTLTSRESVILNMRHGLGEYEEHTLREISEVFSVSPSRIREILEKSYRKLRHPDRRVFLETHYEDSIN